MMATIKLNDKVKYTKYLKSICFKFFRFLIKFIAFAKTKTKTLYIDLRNLVVE